MPAALAYDQKSAEYFGHARVDVLDLLPKEFSCVVDVGGSTGATLSAIRKTRPLVRTICIDAHEASIQAARQQGHEALLCDLEQSLPDVFRASQVVMFLDVLEHLIEPWRQLERIVSQLPAGATVIVSLPNVRFWEASCRLFFFGKWTLKDAGVLDRTHLRFFTRESGAQMLRDAGLCIKLVRPQLPGARRYTLINSISLGMLRDFLTVQYIFVAEKPSESE